MLSSAWPRYHPDVSNNYNQPANDVKTPSISQLLLLGVGLGGASIGLIAYKLYVVLAVVLFLAACVPLVIMMYWPSPARANVFIFGSLLTLVLFSGVAWALFGPHQLTNVSGGNQPLIVSAHPAGSSPSPISSPSSAAPPTCPAEASAAGLGGAHLLAAYRTPGDGSFTADTPSNVACNGVSAIRIRFLKNSNDYEAYFDIPSAFPNVTNWAGKTISCYARADAPLPLRTWAGVDAKDMGYKNDYGSDNILQGTDWTLLSNTVGTFTGTTRNGNPSYHDNGFQPRALHGFSIFFGSDVGDLTGNAIDIADCTHT